MWLILFINIVWYFCILFDIVCSFTMYYNIVYNFVSWILQYCLVLFSFGCWLQYLTILLWILFGFVFSIVQVYLGFVINIIHIVLQGFRVFAGFPSLAAGPSAPRQSCLAGVGGKPLRRCTRYQDFCSFVWNWLLWTHFSYWHLFISCRGR